MTNGDLSGTKRAERLATVVCLGGAVMFIVTLNTINVLTALQDDPARGGSALVSEVTSGLSAIALIWLPWLILARLPLDRPPLWRTLGLHALGLLLFSALHVAGFVLLRQIVYGVFNATYDFGDWTRRFPYELRKDAFYYSVVMLCFWLLRDRIIASALPKAAADEPATFDIRDGARLVRANLSDILAVSSAGNYAEFHLADGRKPLMRASLASLEVKLAEQGFVRTHRSWLVNAARVTELKPEGSGDYAVTLGGVVAPLSRRFPDALARLRGG